jgi:hypothetical protein
MRLTFLYSTATWKTVWKFFTTLQMGLPHDPEILLCIYPNQYVKETSESPWGFFWVGEGGTIYNSQEVETN